MIKITGDINKLRVEIDSIDKQIVDLLLHRIDLVKKVGILKKTNKSRIYVPEREVLIFNKLSAFSNLTSSEIQAFYTEIISACRKHEDILTVGCFYDGNYLLALKKLFGEFVKPFFLKIKNYSEEVKNLNYLIVDFEFLKKFLPLENWVIINTVNVFGTTMYLLSRFENEIETGNDISYTLSSKKLNDSSILLENGYYFSKFDLFFNSNTLSSFFKDNHDDITYIGSNPVSN